MLNKQELQKRRQEDFYKWFERWYEKQNLENEIYKNNCKGSNCLKINLEMTEGFELNRYMEFKELFIELIKEKLGIYASTHNNDNNPFYGLAKRYMFAGITSGCNLTLDWKE